MKKRENQKSRNRVFKNIRYLSEFGARDNSNPNSGKAPRELSHVVTPSHRANSSARLYAVLTPFEQIVAELSPLEPLQLKLDTPRLLLVPPGLHGCQ